MEFELFREPTTSSKSYLRHDGFYGQLPVLGCVADILTRRRLNHRKLAAQASTMSFVSSRLSVVCVRIADPGRVGHL